jgi:hypothetical protein
MKKLLTVTTLLTLFSLSSFATASGDDGPSAGNESELSCRVALQYSDAEDASILTKKGYEVIELNDLKKGDLNLKWNATYTHFIAMVHTGKIDLVRVGDVPLMVHTKSITKYRMGSEIKWGNSPDAALKKFPSCYELKL